MRRFLIAFDQLNINAASVKSGHNDRNVVVACRCINVGLFLSRNLRRDVVISILLGTNDDIKAITFPGLTLKRVSPDERSIAFFLLKAYNFLDEMHMNDNRIMDNGIVLHRMTLKELFNQWLVEECYIASQEFNVNSSYNDISESSPFFYDMTPNHLEFQDYPTKSLPRPPHPERFVLEINLYFDNRK